jgi:hypothetical protein
MKKLIFAFLFLLAMGCISTSASALTCVAGSVCVAPPEPPPVINTLPPNFRPPGRVVPVKPVGPLVKPVNPPIHVPSPPYTK